jgi:hypothetical protein
LPTSTMNRKLCMARISRRNVFCLVETTHGPTLRLNGRAYQPYAAARFPSPRLEEVISNP